LAAAAGMIVALGGVGTFGRGNLYIRDDTAGAS
jgi:hypothetical protein